MIASVPINKKNMKIDCHGFEQPFGQDDIDNNLSLYNIL